MSFPGKLESYSAKANIRYWNCHSTSSWQENTIWSLLPYSTAISDIL